MHNAMMAVRGPIPPMPGMGSRKPKSARLGIVCPILANQTAQRRADGRRARKTALGMPTAAAMAMVISTNSRCCIERVRISESGGVFIRCSLSQIYLVQIYLDRLFLIRLSRVLRGYLGM